MTEHEGRSESARTEGATSRPERLGRWLGVALFWLLAVGFVGASTRSVIHQVFMVAPLRAATGGDEGRSQRCTRALTEAADKLAKPGHPTSQHAPEWVLSQWSTELDLLSAACGPRDDVVMHISAAVARMQRQFKRHADVTEHEHARLVRILRQHAPGEASNRIEHTP